MRATNIRNHAQAVRYRQLALREADKSKATLLNKIADEAERGVLVTAERVGERRPTAADQTQSPPVFTT